VVHFIEWADLWSMGDLYRRWLTPPSGPEPWTIFGDRFEIHSYALPDAGRLGDHLVKAGHQQWDESDWYASRLAEAVGAWQNTVDRAVLVVLREVTGGLVTDDERVASLDLIPDWLSES
jgi:hypothetical protein